MDTKTKTQGAQHTPEANIILSDCRAYRSHPPDENLKQCTEERTRLLASNAKLERLLADALEAMQNESERREQDVFRPGCGNCDAGLPLPHSFGCRARNALTKARGDE